MALVPPEPAYDPACWPESVQAALPASFGRELIAAVQKNLNSSWAEAIEKWDVEVSWIDLAFASTFLKYAEVLRALSLRPENQGDAQKYATKAAKQLRYVSENPKFQDAFAEKERMLMMHSLQVVIRQIPDETTLAWVEREMDRASWKTRACVLDHLICLAPVDAGRTAAIYCSAVDLSRHGEDWVILTASGPHTIDYQAIEKALGGTQPHESLLQSYPETFLSVAVHLAEALNQFKAVSFEGLSDDLTSFWMWDGHAASLRCVRVIKKFALALAEADLNKFLEVVYPVLSESKLASVQSVLLDALVRQAGNPRALDSLASRIADTRFYHFPLMGYWLQQGLKRAWSVICSCRFG